MRAGMLSAAMVVVAVMATGAFGQLAGVSNSPHNLNNVPGVVIPESQVCLPCHTPHNALESGPDGVLWNHEETTQTFTMYSGSTVAASDLAPATKMCLSCHDGVTAIDSYGGTTGTKLIGTVGDGSADLGTDLSNDHPIGIVYPSGDPGYNDPAGLQGVQLVTVGAETNRVECVSCHEPHGNTLGNFLRLTLSESQLCLECHNK